MEQAKCQMSRTKKLSHFIFLLAIIAMVSCSSVNFANPTLPVLTATYESTPSMTFEGATVPSSPPVTVPTHPIATEQSILNMAIPTSDPTINVSITPTSAPISLTWIGNLYWPDSWRDNLWWSSDSQTFFFQDPSTQTAWSYDLDSGQIFSIPFTPRSVDKLAPLLEPALPAGAELFDISPTQRYILYKIRLSEPIPLDPPRYDNDMNPAYFYELWLQQDGQQIKLGLIDNCFGRIRPPNWVTDDHIAVVTTWGTPDVEPSCMHDNWLIDIANRTVAPIPVPTIGAEGYIIEDISTDGVWLLIRRDQNYLFSIETGKQFPIPGANTDDSGLVELAGTPASLFLGLERTYSKLEHHIWYYDPIQDRSILLTTISGIVRGWLIAPNQKFLILVVDNHYYTTVYDNVTPGIWLLDLPETYE